MKIALRIALAAFLAAILVSTLLFTYGQELFVEKLTFEDLTVRSLQGGGFAAFFIVVWLGGSALLVKLTNERHQGPDLRGK